MPVFKDWRCRNLLPLRFVSSKKKRIFGIHSNKDELSFNHWQLIIDH